MPKDKTHQSFEIEVEHRKWLEDMAEKHGLPDPSKALRVVLDFAMTDADQGAIFEEIRCLRC